jgi:hypothetical protein
MRILLLAVAVVCFSMSVSGLSQEKDSCSMTVRQALKQQILPAGMFTASIILNSGEIKKKIQDIFPNTNTHIDNWLIHVPDFQMYTFDLLGVNHRNSVFDQTKYLVISHGVTGAIVQVMKETIHMRRPSGGLHSFPSGHTSYAFVGATALYHEFRDTQPVLAYSGFVFATATGVLRITNDAHWLPDVVAGAAVGILVTNLVYQMEPLKCMTFKGAKNRLAFNANLGENGVYFKITF